MIGSYYTNLDVLSQESIRTIRSSQINHPGIYSSVSDSYGFGHFIEELPDGHQAVWHGGQGHGWMTHFHFLPDSGDGIVILTNSQRSRPFIAQVLSDWARWNNLGPIKTGRITLATTMLWMFISAATMITLWQVYRFAGGLWCGVRIFAPLSVHSFMLRLLQAMTGMSVLATLAWCYAQPYLMISSIFPAAAGWAGMALLAWAAVTILSSLFPNIP